MNANWEDLFEKYLQNSLTEAERQALTDLLEHDEAARAEFADYVSWAGSIACAVGRLPEGQVERAPAFRREKKTATGWIRYVMGPLAAAAAVLLSVYGVNRYMTAQAGKIPVAWVAEIKSRPGTAGQLPDKTPQRALAARSVDGRLRDLRTGDAIYSGDTLAVPAGISAQVKLADQSLIDLNEKTKVQFAVGTDANLSLEEGDLYCVIVKRQEGQQPFAIRTPAGCRTVVTGTSLELRAHVGATGVSVEEGKVDVEAGGRRVAVGALQHVEVDSRGKISDPTGIMLYEIANWKFRQNDLPVGTILFKDDFEKDMSQWIVFDGEAKIVDGVGVNKSRCLRVHWSGPQGMLIVPKLAMRWKNYELVYKFRSSEGTLSHGVVLGLPDNIRKPQPVRNLSSTQADTRMEANQWYDIRVAVRGLAMRMSTESDGKIVSETSGQIGPYTTIGVGWNEAGKNSVVEADDVVIRTIGE